MIATTPEQSELLKIAYESQSDDSPFEPNGYRPLCEGEIIRPGDIYWTNGKWYSCGETIQPTPQSPGHLQHYRGEPMSYLEGVILTVRTDALAGEALTFPVFPDDVAMKHGHLVVSAGEDVKAGQTVKVGPDGKAYLFIPSR